MNICNRLLRNNTAAYMVNYCVYKKSASTNDIKPKLIQLNA